MTYDAAPTTRSRVAARRRPLAVVGVACMVAAVGCGSDTGSGRTDVTTTPRATSASATTPGPGASSPAVGSWRPVPAAGVGYTDITDLSASAPDNAWAVGLQTPGDFGGYVVVRWDGERWSEVESTPWLASTILALDDNDVWMTSVETDGRPVAHHFTGTSWAQLPLPSPQENGPGDGATVVDLTALSAQDVWGVGHVLRDGEPIRPYAVRWDGARWTEVAAAPLGEESQFAAVSAVSATEVWAVGRAADDSRPGDHHASTAIAARWDGRRWQPMPLPELPFDSRLSAVSARSATDVWAVGAAGGRPLALHYDGRAWNVLPHIPLEHGTLTSLAPDGADGMWVSAASRRKEGSDIPGPAVILHWDGTAWRTARKVPAVTLNVLAQVPDTPMVWAAGGFWSGSTEGPEHDYFEVTGRLG